MICVLKVHDLTKNNVGNCFWWYCCYSNFSSSHTWLNRNWITQFFLWEFVHWILHSILPLISSLAVCHRAATVDKIYVWKVGKRSRYLNNNNNKKIHILSIILFKMEGIARTLPVSTAINWSDVNVKTSTQKGCKRQSVMSWPQIWIATVFLIKTLHPTS